MELDTPEEFMRNTQEFLKTPDGKAKAIHMVWYVVDCTQSRIAPFEAK